MSLTHTGKQASAATGMELGFINEVALAWKAHAAMPWGAKNFRRETYTGVGEPF
jgi:hypothetical protein